MVVCSALPSLAKSCLGSISLVWVPLHSNQAQHHLPIKQEKQLSCTSSPALSGSLLKGKERESLGMILLKVCNVTMDGPISIRQQLNCQIISLYEKDVSGLNLKKMKIKSYTPPLHLTIVSRLCMRAYVVLWIQVVDC